ncbi:related to PTM1-member of the major facilitator superfamily [Rhynchosporium agropyri]|uniref:Related to PTM1-member of the major facilitator superfamily n=1 Tax=Rhynchosporium agropyri TaxID=914238 RepID=A0A1E1KFP0_9HELO|nr:related to PTM1-member of the major facilitator superfamily [Rhynchosporium agropyri]
MRSWLHGLLLLGLFVVAARSNEMMMDQKDENRQICAGMYSRAAWGGDVEPHILVKFVKDTKEDDSDPITSLVIFEWKDYDLIGVLPTADSISKEFICDTESIDNKFCNANQTGEFIMSENATEISKNLLFTKAVHLKDPGLPINYAIKKTGYFCVGTTAFSPSDVQYTATVEFRNAYGELPAAQIAKLPFYGGITVVYAVIGAFWAFLYAQHRHDILPVQNYITAIIMFLIVEMLMTWLFYDYMNRNGSSIGSKVLMILVAVLNAGRNSFSFFLLLIVCMGYGVVKHSLGKTMIYVRYLAGAHFVFGLIYSVASLTVTPETAGPLVLFVILPLAGTLTAFYVWTLNSLNLTMKDLLERKQTQKFSMYRKLWWAILGSIMVIFGFFFFNSFTFASASDRDFVPFHWKTRWFILDGWLNLVYLGDVVFIAYLWRPTANNRRFAMSDELAQDDEGFEIADFGVEDDDEEDPENAGAHRGDRTQPGQEGPRYDPAAAAHAPKPSIPRESLDGETIFAVGEDGDRWSDDESDDEARGKLVNKTKDA